MNGQREERNMMELRKFRDKHGDAALERVRELMLKKAESFPDRDRCVVWLIDVSPSGEITLDVRP